ncbi:major facilitator superfamily domain-containing protein [Leucosporidium creatinivorum]|uniref:Major facilitator superfamily domain-containing protein n=1 Tax=Leucosporidium creatinivorum TaxID=106004 RepID=A0A1Y2D782_9BASI|nr:major facilitator superfamily domain-containing protein [Leucosporidium creatinivorum]
MGLPAATVAELDSSTDGTVYKTHWFRSSYFQAFVLGLASFCCPGIWGAMANLGAGGLQSASTGNAATAVTFALMVFTCLLGSPLLGKFGPRICLILGTYGYAPYAAGLYCNSKFGTQWGVIFGAACCGLSAGIFWATEGTCIATYPEPERRGRAIALWFSINQLGSVLGGAVNLALNVKLNKIGGISVNTYAVFIAIQCLGPGVALLLSNPSQVQRKDGRKPLITTNKLGFFGELKATVSLWKRPTNWILGVLFFMTQWGSGSTGYYLATYFTVRSRALSSLCTALLSQSLIYALGAWSDNTRFSVRFRATTTAAVLMVGLGYSWIHFLVNQYDYSRREVAPVFDWSQGGIWFGAWFPVVAQSLFSQLLYNWLYWVVAFLATGEEQGRQVATMRSVESLSSTLTYGVSAAAIPHINLVGASLAIYISGIPAVIFAVLHVSRREEHGLNVLAATEETEQAEAIEEKGSVASLGFGLREGVQVAKRC